MRPLSHAEQTLLTINDRGMLKAQHIVHCHYAQDENVHFEHICCTIDTDGFGDALGVSTPAGIGANRSAQSGIAASPSY